MPQSGSPGWVWFTIASRVAPSAATQPGWALTFGRTAVLSVLRASSLLGTSTAWPMGRVMSNRMESAAALHPPTAVDQNRWAFQAERSARVAESRKPMRLGVTWNWGACISAAQNRAKAALLRLSAARPSAASRSSVSAWRETYCPNSTSVSPSHSSTAMSIASRMSSGIIARLLLRRRRGVGGPNHGRLQHGLDLGLDQRLDGVRDVAVGGVAVAVGPALVPLQVLQRAGEHGPGLLHVGVHGVLLRM